MFKNIFKFMGSETSTSPRPPSTTTSEQNLPDNPQKINENKPPEEPIQKKFGRPARDRDFRGATQEREVSSDDHRNEEPKPSILSQEQEKILVEKTVRFADAGFPITSKSLQRCIFRFCSENNIEIREIKGAAGRDWLRGFLRRNPELSARKVSRPKEERTERLNQFLVMDFFEKLKNAFAELDISDKPERIFNFHEKEISLGSQGDKVTVLISASAMGWIMPPMILIKKDRMKPELNKNMPISFKVATTEKGTMNSDTFAQWLEHLEKFKPAGKSLIIIDGSTCDMDYSILEAAEKSQNTLLCLPSNSTHELQPLAKGVLKAFDFYWEDQISTFTTNNPAGPSHSDFGKIFTPVWNKLLDLRNIRAGFESCGIFPLNRDMIRPYAYAPTGNTSIRPLPCGDISDWSEDEDDDESTPTLLSSGKTKVNLSSGESLEVLLKVPTPSSRSAIRGEPNDRRGRSETPMRNTQGKSNVEETPKKSVTPQRSCSVGPLEKSHKETISCSKSATKEVEQMESTSKNISTPSTSSSGGSPSTFHKETTSRSKSETREMEPKKSCLKNSGSKENCNPLSRDPKRKSTSQTPENGVPAHPRKKMKPKTQQKMESSNIMPWSLRKRSITTIEKPKKVKFMFKKPKKVKL